MELTIKKQIYHSNIIFPLQMLLYQLTSNIEIHTYECQRIQNGLLNPNLNAIVPSMIDVKEAEEMLETENGVLTSLGKKIAFTNVTDLYNPL